VNDVTRDDKFFFRFNEDGRIELVENSDIVADNKEQAELVRKLHRARMRNTLRVIKGGKD
jgi:hypothetical protein